jgi:hypothetical protein
MIILTKHRNMSNLKTTKDFVEYKELLEKAHKQFKDLRIDTQLLHVPTSENGNRAIFKAMVDTGTSTFSGHGEADLYNTEGEFQKFLISSAETRAKGRALKDAIGDGRTTFEELKQETAGAIVLDKEKDAEKGKNMSIDALEKSIESKKVLPTGEVEDKGGHKTIEDLENQVGESGDYNEVDLQNMSIPKLCTILADLDMKWYTKLKGKNTNKKLRGLIVAKQSGNLDEFLASNYPDYRGAEVGTVESVTVEAEEKESVITRSAYEIPILTTTARSFPEKKIVFEILTREGLLDDQDSVIDIMKSQSLKFIDCEDLASRGSSEEINSVISEFNM